MGMGGWSQVANGNIYPCRFVKDDTADGMVVQAGAGDRVRGISGSGTRSAPYPGLDSAYHAVAGDNCLLYGPGTRDVPLELGGTVTKGGRIKSDADGKGVASTTDKDQYGAIAE